MKSSQFDPSLACLNDLTSENREAISKIIGININNSVINPGSSNSSQFPGQKRPADDNDLPNELDISKKPNQNKDDIITTATDSSNSGTFPQGWRNTIVFIIPKSTPGKFRPIS
nr:PREDICTED: uncharacterized protein LOC105669373 [Linepithema humile]